MSSSESQPQRGHQAEKPSHIPKGGWKEIAKRTKAQIKADHVQIVAAGVAFYFFLALFPAIAAALSIYGLVVDPDQAESQIEHLAGLLPEQAHAAFVDIARNLTSRSGQALGWGLLLSILFSLWSANKGSKGLFEGLNIAYDEEDERGFLKKNAVTLLYTFVAIIGGLLALALVAGFPAVSGALGLPDPLRIALNLLRWPVVVALVLGLLGFAYRLAPDREHPQWRWVSWGSGIATGLWILGSIAFSLYVANFGNFANTYGSFAAVIVLMLWFFLSAFIILLGAEINSEMEHQTRVDTTTGEAEPMGKRGAYHADHVPEGA